jgi:hypothetical protein
MQKCNARTTDEYDIAQRRYRNNDLSMAIKYG